MAEQSGELHANAQNLPGNETYDGVEGGRNTSGLPYDPEFVFLMQKYHIIISVFACTTGLIVNSLVIVAFLRRRRLRTTTNWFVFSLTLSDLMTSTIMMVFGIGTYASPQLAHLTGWCVTFNGFRLIVNYCTQLLSHLLITIDRLVAVTQPLKHRSIITKRRAKILVVSVWLFSYVYGYVPAVAGFDIPPWITMCDGRFRYSKVYIMIFQYGIFTALFFTILVLYLMIYIVVRIQLRRQIGEVTVYKFHRRVSYSATIAKTMFMLLAIFTLTWVPNMTITHVLLYCDQVEIRGQVFAICDSEIDHVVLLTVKQFSYTFVALSLAINPLLYSYRIRMFRHEIRKMLCCKCLTRFGSTVVQPIRITVVSK
ncbi:adenosine receptor A1-like [Ptychodera flava]|uniref:adenosine receptor A1-like n=1 Tax=Ptychodera flava TaxID=63121 RepID=UPI003969CBCD